MEPSFPEPTAFNNLATAVANLHAENGHALPNRFEVMIYPPSVNYALARNVSLRCESILLPGRNLDTGTDGMPYGPTREIVDGVTYAEDIAMTFVASAGLEERVFFEEWQELAFNKKTWNVGYYDDYVGTVEIYLLNRQDERRFGIKLIEAFPKTIDGTDLSQPASSEIIKTSVSFSFRYWETIDQNRSTSDRAGKLPPPHSEKIFNMSAKPATRNLSSNMPSSVSRLGGGGGNVSYDYRQPTDNQN